jgi:glutamate formiminotransferase
MTDCVVHNSEGGVRFILAIALLMPESHMLLQVCMRLQLFDKSEEVVGISNAR